jgi:hypothetical protein
LGYQLIRDWKLVGNLATLFVIGVCSNINFSLVVVIVVAITGLIFLCCSAVLKWNIKNVNYIGLINLVSLMVFTNYGYVFYKKLPNLPKSYYANIYQQEYSLSANAYTVNSLPDIYFIVLDGYARSDILMDFYLFDNSEFLDSLKSRGFVVPSESRSNYAKTAVSITSTLNMEYIDTLIPGLDDSNNWWLMSPYIDNSRVRSALENLNYTTISLATDWSITDNPTSEIYYTPSRIMITDFEYFFINSTPLVATKSILSNIAFIPSYNSHRELVNYNFETLARIPELRGPKFVFAHIISPHPPFVFNADGTNLQPDYPFGFDEANDYPDNDEHYRQGYIGQVQYINNRIMQMVESIIIKSKIPPIIILQADHGPGMLTDFRSVDNTCLKERFSIFAAYYLPGIDLDSIPNDITPVNLFRVIFNKYFNSNFPFLDRFHYYFKDTVYIFRSEDVTDAVDTCSIH